MTLIRGLGYAGLLPFFGLLYLAWQPALGSSAQAIQLFHIYSALILAFMAGGLWPVLYRPEAPALMAVVAVSFPVISFLAFALLPAFVTAVQALLFLALRLTEVVSGIDRDTPAGYGMLRWQLTTAVVFCHLAMIFIG